MFFDYHFGSTFQLDIHLSRLLADDIIRESAQTRYFAASRGVTQMENIPRTAPKSPTVSNRLRTVWFLGDTSFIIPETPS